MKKILNSVILAALLAACTDYVAEIDDRYGEWETSDVTQSSSNVTPQSNDSETSVSSNSEVNFSSPSVFSSSNVPENYIDPSTVVKGELVDSRDGQTYKTVTIGSQTWMAENLNYETENSYCYNDSAEYCSKYGRFYTWAAATTACPDGWHLPTSTEFGVLELAVGNQIAGKMLKSTSGNGTDSYSFAALPAGSRNQSGSFEYVNFAAIFWSSSVYDSNSAIRIDFLSEVDYVFTTQFYKSSAYSVRCLKDEGTTPQSSSSKVTEPAEVTTGTMTDSRNGQTYKTVTIGTQTWMAQNLNYESEGSYCYKDSAEHCTKYGRLYTWAAAMTACPSGWHLPTKAEFETLFTAVGGQSTAGKVIKSTSGWNSSGNGTDAFAFSALPAGFRDIIGGYNAEGDNASFWSSTEDGSYFARSMSLNYNDGVAGLNYSTKDNGSSVRCLKD